MPRIKWAPVLEHAADIVGSYQTAPTLRQLFYRLVVNETLPNTLSRYKDLSANTAQARRDGWFPPLFDRTRRVHQPATFDSPKDALEVLADRYRRDRTEGQQWQVWLAVEKHALVGQLTAWFDDLGVPILALGGYASQSYTDVVAGRVRVDGRAAVLLYAGDLDPTGEDIDRDFVERTGGFDKVIRVALTADQVDAYDLPPAVGKASDSRASAFVARHGRLIQVELDALDPDTLRGLYQDALDGFWDMSAFEASVAAERAEARRLEQIADDEP
jgi:hypothetical protein